jgi:hypothetical protein
MSSKGSAFCAICLQPFRKNQRWFLLTENRWTDRLRILRWDEKLAANAELYPACGVEHVQQLVVHWMTTGSLHYPFACTEAPPAVSGSSKSQGSRSRAQADTAGMEILGELAVDRNSMPRILVDNAESLGSLLIALAQALTEPESASDVSLKECKDDGAYALVDA